MALPEPRKILWGLDNVQGNEEPEEDASPCLREANDHKRFLFLFAKTVMIADSFKKCSTSLLLSDYMSTNLESYAVLTYVNNYECWKEEASRTPRRGEEVSEVTGPSSSDGSKRRYTDSTRGTGKFKGWAEAGINLYNSIDTKLEQQRDDPALGDDFDKKLRTWYLSGREGSEDTASGGGRPHSALHARASFSFFRSKKRRSGIEGLVVGSETGL